MNEPTTKEEALRLLDQLQSKFNITKRDINESFNKSLTVSNTYKTKISLITWDEAILKIMIPFNAESRWNNNIKDYPIVDCTDSNGKFYLEWSYHWEGGNGVNMKLPQHFKIRTNRHYTECGFLNEYNYAVYGNQAPAAQYQDNHKDYLEIRLKDIDYNSFKKNVAFGNDDTDRVAKSGNVAYSGFLPIMSYEL